MDFEEMAKRYEKLAIEHEELAQEWSRPTGDSELDVMNRHFAEQQRLQARRWREKSNRLNRGDGCRMAIDDGRNHTDRALAVECFALHTGRGGNHYESAHGGYRN